MATIQEVAEHAGVSAGTVSRYLNGHQLKAANQIRVERAIEELGYRSNYLARGLRSKRSMSIGLLVNNMLNHFAVSLVAQVEREMEINDYNIILSGFRESRDIFVHKLEGLIDRRVDGLILCEPIQDERARDLIEHCEVPVLAISNLLPYRNVDNILVSSRESCRAVTARMIQAGHERIGVLAATQTEYVAQERLSGVLEAFDDAGLPRQGAIVRIGGYGREFGYQDMKRLIMEDHVDCVFALNYGRGQGAQQAIDEFGLRIGENFSFACYDYLDTKIYSRPNITAVHPPSIEIGSMAATRILSMIEDGSRATGGITYVGENIEWMPSIVGMD